MKEGQKNKKSSKKWLIAIVLVVIIAAIAFVFYQGIIFTLPTGLATGTNTEAAGGAAAPANGPTITSTGNEIISKSVVDASLPYYEAIDLEPGKYRLEVNTDDPVWIKLYPKLHFDEWQKTGAPGAALTGTNFEEKDKVKNYDSTFAVYIGQGGKFYLLILGDKSTTIKYKITQILKLQ